MSPTSSLVASRAALACFVALLGACHGARASSPGGPALTAEPEVVGPLGPLPAVEGGRALHCQEPRPWERPNTGDFAAAGSIVTKPEVLAAIARCHPSEEVDFSREVVLRVPSGDPNFESREVVAFEVAGTVITVRERVHARCPGGVELPPGPSRLFAVPAVGATTVRYEPVEIPLDRPCVPAP